MKNARKSLNNQARGVKVESSSLDLYLHEIGKFHLISRAREVQLAAKIKRGDQTALDELVQANLRFVVSVAKRYQNQGMLLADLINEGNVGLIKAAKRFDASRGFVFISYAVWWIRQAILKALAEQSRVFRLPLNRTGDKYTVNEASQKLLHNLDREPSIEEIMAVTALTEEEVLATYRVSDSYISLEMRFDGDSDEALMDILADARHIPVTTALEREELQTKISNFLKTFSERDAEIFRLFFGLHDGQPLTLEEIGERFNLSRERVRQINKRILRWFQHPIRMKQLREYTRSDRTF